MEQNSTVEKETKIKEPVVPEPFTPLQGQKNHTVTMDANTPKFNGIARTVEAYDNHGFRNFRILTLHIVKGVIRKIDYSDAYASFEAISRLEIWNEMSVWNLNNNWKAGATLIK